MRGPSADGVPGPTLTSTFASGGSGASVRNASQRPGSAARARRETTASCSSSAGVAIRAGCSAPPARMRIVAITAAGSTRWSKPAKSSASRRTGPPSGCRETSRGGGVLKLHEEERSSAVPVALVAPAASVAWYSLAIAKRPSGSNTSVRVPTQRHSPFTSGSSRTGTLRIASAAWEPSATIGSENVTDR